jgi:two-component system, sensor histidine kinase and response regulator
VSDQIPPERLRRPSLMHAAVIGEPAVPSKPSLTREWARPVVSGLLTDAANVLLAILLVGLFWGSGVAQEALAWLGLVVVAVGVRALVRPRLSHSDPEARLRAQRLSVLLLTVAWAIGPVLVLQEASFGQLAMVMVAFAGIAAGGSGTLLTDRTSFYTLVGGLSLGLAVGLIVSDAGRVSIVALLLVALFGVVISTVYEEARRTLHAQLETARLLRAREQEAARERGYLSALLASAPSAIATVDGAGVVKDINPAFTRLFGYSVEEALGKQLDDLVVPTDAMAEAKVLEGKALAGGGTVAADVDRRTKNGDTVPVRVSAALVRGVESVTLFVLYDDITATRRAQEALREAERQYRELVESASDLVWQVDTEGRWVFLNAAAATLYGVAAEGLIGRPFADQVDPEHRDRDVARMGQVLTGDELSDYETIHVDVNGVRRHLSFAARPVHSADGAVVGAHGTARDVTERAQARAALVEAREAAERVAQLRSAFVANMSHELRTPLHGILGLVDLLLDSDLTPDQRRSAELVHNSGDALLRIIDDILDFSKIEAGRLELEAIPFDLNGLVESTARLLAVKAASRGIEVLVDMDADVPRTVIGDPGRLRQVLTNLMGNAIKFTNEGEIVIAVSRVGGTDALPELRIGVRDTGIGIPPDRLEAIFEEFTQADVSTSRTYGGTGLGLAVSQRLVSMMRGRLAVTSEVGKGSEFSFVVPLPVKEIESSAPSAVTLPTLPPGRDVLVVDDSASNRRIVREMLRFAGMRVDEADGAGTALDRLHVALADGKPHDVVVFDGHMPGQDGFALAAKIRAEPGFAETRLILLTSAAQRGDGQKCRDLGIDGYLTKPVARVELLEAVSAVLGGVAAKQPDPLVTRYSMQENRRRLRVLVAEDNLVNQHVVAALLKRRGHEVVMVENGRLAFEAVRDKKFDVVLMDVQMPEMDGWTATRKIQELPDRKDLPIVAATAHALPEDRERCLAAGMVGCVVKPFRPHELFAVLEGWGGPAEAPEERDDQPVVDLAAVRQAMREAGAEDIVDDLVRTFLDDAPNRVAAIEEAAAGGDAAAVGRAAHSYKSAAGAIGARRLAEALRELEMAGKEGNRAALPPLVGNVRSAHDAVLEYLTPEMEHAKRGE